MRAYFFGNMYLSSIQQGIQAGHVIGEMVAKYSPIKTTIEEELNNQYHMAAVRLWAQEHKTMILLNAGYGENIRSLHKFFDSKQNPYPFAIMHEAQEALDGAATSVGIVVPEQIYIGAAQLRNGGWNDVKAIEDAGEVRWFNELDAQICVPVTIWERKLMVEMNKYGLAS